MHLPKNVKVKPKYWNLFPWVSEKTATTLYLNIYLPKLLYKDLMSNKPDPYHVAILIHEQTHVQRIKNTGAVKFLFKYLFDSKFRIQEELVAIEKSMKYIKDRKLTWNVEKTAKQISSWLYFWPVSFETANKKVDNIWKSI